MRRARGQAQMQDDKRNHNQGRVAIDYLVLVNKTKALPDGWEDELDTVVVTNSLGAVVEVERRAFGAYEALKADLERTGIHVSLDSAKRGVGHQRQIMDEYTEEFGADYARKFVARPGYSEHHTGLALDLYLNIDGVDVYTIEEMVQYQEVWHSIHTRLAEHGFILRYLDGREHITGYAYEPWHIRYVDDRDVATEIVERGITLEEYLGGNEAAAVTYELHGMSERYSEDDLEDAALQVKCEFAAFAGCELQRLRYVGDACNSKENLDWLNGLDGGGDYTEVLKLCSDFHAPVDGGGACGTDGDVTDYPWWLARREGEGWQLVTWGY